MKFFALYVAIFATVVQLASAARHVAASKGYPLDKRVRKTGKMSSESAYDTDLRRWKEEDYEAIMTTMSGGLNLRHRRTQHRGGSGYQKKPYYTRQQVIVRKWQKVALATIITATVALGFYVCALKRELSTLNQYLPLGYKLFPDSDPEEERVGNGVEMS